ncbi:hypothetical protein [Aquabacter cavernae]|uniref:hypothetical protein n=1 Tax=Aquabacter cavernae TaxID=2496029 RepID=UPI000F8E03D1|nr:hypothetical protein [Aquabacter cavernae]
MNTLPPFQTWTQAWQNAAQTSGNPAAAAQLLWFELPVEIAGRLQRFTAARMQDQMRLFTEMNGAEGVANPFMREAAFLQESSLAWGSEVLQIMELCQERLLNTSRAESQAPIHYPKAAA